MSRSVKVLGQDALSVCSESSSIADEKKYVTVTAKLLIIKGKSNGGVVVVIARRLFWKMGVGAVSGQRTRKQKGPRQGDLHLGVHE